MHDSKTGSSLTMRLQKIEGFPHAILWKKQTPHADFTYSTKAGTTALTRAVDTVKANKDISSILVVAADTRKPEPSTMWEFGFADEKLKGTFRYRPPDYEKGCSNNPSIGRLFGSQLENSWMMLRYYHFTGNDITEYLPFIEQSVLFYDENFRMREKLQNAVKLSCSVLTPVLPWKQ